VGTSILQAGGTGKGKKQNTKTKNRGEKRKPNRQTGNKIIQGVQYHNKIYSGGKAGQLCPDDSGGAPKGFK